MRQFQVDKERQEVELQDLKDKLEADTPQEQALEGLEKDLAEAEEELTLNQSMYQDSVNEKDKLSAENKPIRTQLNDMESELAEIEERINHAERAYNKAAQKRETKQFETNRKHEEVGDAEKTKERLIRDRDAQVSLVQDFDNEAQKISSRIPIDDGETTDSLEAKLNKLSAEKAHYAQQ
jgi:structural maintenance of chromosomes protein 6